MIFLFFTSSLGPLEPKLAPLKKKEIHQNLTPKNMSKSSPSMKVWSHEGSNLYPKMVQ